MSSTNISIILTTSVIVTRNTSFQINKQDRINTYLKSIKSWLKYTNFNIIVVENTGYFFQELQNELNLYNNRFEIISYDESEEKKQCNDHQMHLDSKGGCEISSIHYAFNKSNILNKSIFIIKITGRFFIPSFKEYLNNIDLTKYDCLRQNFKNRCEIVGTNIKNFNIIFDKNLFIKNGIYDYHVENVYDYRFTLFKHVIICPIFDIEPTPRGGLNEIYSQL